MRNINRCKSVCYISRFYWWHYYALLAKFDRLIIVIFRILPSVRRAR